MHNTSVLERVEEIVGGIDESLLKMQRALRVGDIVHVRKVRFEWLSSPRTRLFGKLEYGSGVDTARWWETGLTRPAEWLYEDLHCRQAVISPAVQALTRCAMLGRDCRDLCFQPVGSLLRFFSFSEHMVCNVDIRKNLYFSVVSHGGTTNFQEVVEHMTNEMTALAPSTMS